MDISSDYPLILPNREIIKGEVKLLCREVKLIDDDFKPNEETIFKPIKKSENELWISRELLILSSIMITTLFILNQTYYYLIDLKKSV